MKTIDDVLLNKAATISRCLKRIAEEADACPNLDNYTHMDALILNLERACQATIDMAMHCIAKNNLGVPQSSADAFALLAAAGIIDQELAGKLRSMVGFRNIAVHDYQGLDLSVIKYILAEGINDFIEFCQQMGIKVV